MRIFRKSITEVMKCCSGRKQQGQLPQAWPCMVGQAARSKKGPPSPKTGGRVLVPTSQAHSPHLLPWPGRPENGTAAPATSYSCCPQSLLLSRV